MMKNFGKIPTAQEVIRLVKQVSRGTYRATMTCSADEETKTLSAGKRNSLFTMYRNDLRFKKPYYHRRIYMKEFCFLLAVIMFCSFNTTVFASEDIADEGCLEAETVYVGVETRSINTVTTSFGARPATMEDIIESNQMQSKPITTESTVMPRATWTYLSGYAIYNQTTSYNCGPAAVQAALKYLNGDTPTQAEIAKGCGTTSTEGTYLSDMLKYINEEQSENTYVSKYQATETKMKDYLYSGVVTYDAPPIIGLAFSENDGWQYSSGGHFVSAYGAKSDKSEFKLGDPWIGYNDLGTDKPWGYIQPADRIFKAYNSVNIGLMY